MKTPSHDELRELLEALCEDRMTDEQRALLEQSVLGDAEARRLYLDYMDLHGTLHWDAAANTDAMSGVAEVRASAPTADLPPAGRWNRILWTSSGVVAAAVIAVVVAVSSGRFGPEVDPDQPPIANAEDGPSTPDFDPDSLAQPIIILNGRENTPPDETGPTSVAEAPSGVPEDAIGPDASASRLGIVAFIDDRIAAGWRDVEIEPSAPADDSEWMRRIYLDLAGRIPPPETVEEFLANTETDKRGRLIEDLLSHADTSRHFATVWTNLLIGRTSDSEIDRDGLHRFLERQFRVNRPWSETVTELIAAEGSGSENGAANFLLAHLNNEAVPATAVTARCFLGMQVQCTQCHKHPFYEQWGQEQFWELNSFFQQTEVVRHTINDAETGRSQFSHLELVSRNVGGPTWYETRAGEMKVVYPRFEGVDVDSGPETDRRSELSRLLIAGENPQLAKAFVNRMWAHFFGYGFTNPIDDMGPHKAPTHRDLLDRLSDEFVKSGYDVKQLCRVICHSRPYQLTSRMTEGNEIDDPSLGDPPYFSRMYIKNLTAEQVFDSLLVATQADRSNRYFTGEADARRQVWLAQFFAAEQTEENCESTTFDGALPQALALMNGELVQEAVSGAPGTRFGQVLRLPGGETEKIRALSMAALSRYPTTEELEAIRGHLRQNVRMQTQSGRNTNPRTAVNEALRDIFWAYLNSSEFIVNH